MLLVATLSLAAAVFVYAFDRGGVAYFLSGWTVAFPKTNLLGPLGQNLPTFLHTLAFILITAAILRPWPRSLPIVCLAWFSIECLFELGQRTPFDTYIAMLLPDWFGAAPVLGLTANYFICGTYDTLDIVSIGLGAIVAYPMVRICLRGDRS